MQQTHRSIANLKRAAVAVAAATTLAACSALTGENSSVNPSWLIYNGMVGTVSAPDTVTHGVLFPVTINTIGGGCTQEAADNAVTVNGLTVEIRPTDRTRIVNNCPTDLRFLTHTVNVQIASTGVATIKVIGLTDTPDANAANNQYTIQRTVIVR